MINLYCSFVKFLRPAFGVGLYVNYSGSDTERIAEMFGNLPAASLEQIQKRDGTEPGGS